MSEEEKQHDSRKGDLTLVAADVQLQCNCPALLRQVKGELPVVMQCTMELVRNKPQMTTKNTEALHTWQLLEEMMEAILKLAKDIDAALATCFVKLQDLHRRVVHDLYHPDVLKMKTQEAISRMIRRCKPKLDEFNEAVATFKNLPKLIDAQKDLKKALRDVGTEWAKKAMECTEEVQKMISTKWESNQNHLEKENNKLVELLRQRENLNLEEKVQQLEFWEKKSAMAAKNAREFQELECEASKDYAQESETKIHYYTTGWWLWTTLCDETVENPRKEEKRRNKDYLEEEAKKYEGKHKEVNDKIAQLKKDVAFAQTQVDQIDKQIADLTSQMEIESELMKSAFDEAIKEAKKERKNLAVAKENFGTAAALMNVLEAMDRFQLLSRQGDSVHVLLCRMLENISIRYSDWLEAMEDLAEDPRDDDCLNEVRIAREYIANPKIAHPNPFFDMDIESENAGKKLLEY